MKRKEQYNLRTPSLNTRAQTSNLRSTGIFFRWGSEGTVGKDAAVESLQTSSSRDILGSDGKCPLYDSGTTLNKVSSVLVGFRSDALDFPCWVRFRGSPSEPQEHNALCSLDRSESSSLCAVLVRFSSKSESPSDFHSASLPMARSPWLLSSLSRDRSLFPSLYKKKWTLLL